ncbi:MAG TPA: glycosyltransferase [Gaiellaceae bacterium]|nr:glycosyltransferase [Gaiellaceae bacterium]
MDASIVIPTRDRPASLARCLAALERQSFAGALEILVVDDGSTDAKAVASAVETSPRARMLENAGRGPAAARNHGATATRGAAVLFVDDDCEPEASWAEHLVAALENGADAAYGDTVNGHPDNAFSEASQTIANFLESPGQGSTGQPFGTSNNVGCRAEVIRNVPFDERFALAAAEDRDWCARLAAAGLELVSVPAAVVVHRHDLTFRRFVRQQFNYGRGAYLFRRSHGSALRLAPARFYTGLVRAGFERGMLVGALVGLAQGITAAGYAEAAVGRRAS